jgi:hypothetical protein
MMSTRAFQDLALRLASPAADVANYCDHTDHNEMTDRAWVADAGRTLVREACAFANVEGLSIVELYAERLGAIEARNVLAHPGAYDGHSAALEAKSWRDLQLIQVQHDRYYHPDVIGLSKAGQLQHYALHLAKLVGAFAVAADADDLLRRRLPDVLLFGIKLLTVMGVRMTDDALPRLAAGSDATARV